MVSILLTLNAIICVALIILILLQRSDTSSGGMFGGTGSGAQTVVRNPLARPTAILAGLFLVFSVMAAVFNKGGSHAETVMATAEVPAAPTLPEAALVGTPAGAAVTATTPVASTTIITTPTEPTE